VEKFLNLAVLRRAHVLRFMLTGVEPRVIGGLPE